VLPDTEDRLIVFLWTKHRNVMNRQTDGRTDRQIYRANTALSLDAL